ncbi:hypothetical protein GTW71_13460, partial [Streptomyces sp. SID6041]|nr:hypothetical protein [Streptomyces sp. SID6041]
APAPPGTATARGAALLPRHPETCDALADLLGVTDGWGPVGGPAEEPAGAAVLFIHRATCDAVADLLGCDGSWAPAAGTADGPSLTARHPATAHAVAALLTAP